MSEHTIVPLASGSIAFLPFRPSFHLPLRFTVNATDPSHASESVPSPCRLHLDISLPDAVFYDRDELRDALPDFDWTLRPDVIDIERPVQPSAPLSHLHLAPTDRFFSRKPRDGEEFGERKVKIPIHARYLEPKAAGLETIWLFSGVGSGQVKGGWVCGNPSIPFEAVNDLPIVPTMPIPLTLPTGKPSHQGWVDIGTTVSIWICFVWLAWKIWTTSTQVAKGGVKEKSL